LSQEESQEKKNNSSTIRRNLRPIIGMAIVSLFIAGVFFPLLVTAIAQVAMPWQANGEVVVIHGQTVGSNLIDNNFTLPIFFHARNNSASGVDPDITLPDAYSQIPGISNATGISATALTKIVNENKLGTLWIFGSAYVNVLDLNRILIDDYPAVYASFPELSS